MEASGPAGSTSSKKVKVACLRTQRPRSLTLEPLCSNGHDSCSINCHASSCEPRLEDSHWRPQDCVHAVRRQSLGGNQEEEAGTADQDSCWGLWFRRCSHALTKVSEEGVARVGARAVRDGSTLIQGREVNSGVVIVAGDDLLCLGDQEHERKLEELRSRFRFGNLVDLAS